jgi:putative flippase GtrA
MKRLFQLLVDSPKKRYLFVGGSVYVLELAVIYSAIYLHASQLVAVGISFWIGLLASFGLQKFFTFKDKRVERKVVGSQFAAMCTLVLFNFGFTLLLAKLLSPYLPAFVIRTLALGITTLWNFYIYQSHIFSRKDSIIID